MHLCGCKLSSKAPFCDTVTCKKLLRGEPISIQEAELAHERDEDYYAQSDDGESETSLSSSEEATEEEKSSKK